MRLISIGSGYLNLYEKKIKEKSPQPCYKSPQTLLHFLIKIKALSVSFLHTEPYGSNIGFCECEEGRETSILTLLT